MADTVQAFITLKNIHMHYNSILMIQDGTFPPIVDDNGELMSADRLIKEEIAPKLKADIRLFIEQNMIENIIMPDRESLLDMIRFMEKTADKYLGGGNENGRNMSG